MIDIRAEAPDHPAARWCLDQYFGELERRFENGFTRAKDPPAPDTQFLPPGGIFLLARIDGAIAGCGAMKRVDDETGEIKRIWTAPAARGKGVARAIMDALEYTKGDRAIAANLLGIGRTTLYRKLKEYQLAV